MTPGEEALGMTFCADLLPGGGGGVGGAGLAPGLPATGASFQFSFAICRSRRFSLNLACFLAASLTSKQHPVINKFFGNMQMCFLQQSSHMLHFCADYNYHQRLTRGCHNGCSGDMLAWGFALGRQRRWSWCSFGARSWRRRWRRRGGLGSWSLLTGGRRWRGWCQSLSRHQPGLCARALSTQNRISRMGMRIMQSVSSNLPCTGYSGRIHNVGQFRALECCCTNFRVFA